MTPSNHLDSGTVLQATHPEFWNRLRVPGLTGSHRSLAALTARLPKKLAVLSARSEKPFFWVVFLGGTGTGKSTVFNALCREAVSATGVERPKTTGPVVYAHSNQDIEGFLPFFLPQFETRSLPPAAQGEPDRLMLVKHQRSDLAHLALVDTPDLDSLVEDNQRLAEDLFLLADAVVFVTSQEKYADDVLVRALQRVSRSHRPLYLLVNKVEDRDATSPFLIQDLQSFLDAGSPSITSDRIWILPFIRQNPARSLRQDAGFSRFSRSMLHELAPEKVGRILKEQNRQLWSASRQEIEEVRQHILNEELAAEKWLANLENLCAESRDRLLQRAEKRFQESGKKHIQAEIRRLYSRFDLLARPRRAVLRTLSLPFRLLRPDGGPSDRSGQDPLDRIRRRTEMQPVLQALDELQKRCLERLSPSDAGLPLHSCLRSSQVLIGRQEAESRIQAEQEHLAAWLQERFRSLSHEVPRSRKYGIYSTSILWGVLLISFETVVGGGLTLIDALVDSALAPFLTKGAVELFVYREVQAIARELAERYRSGLLSILEVQRDRFAACLHQERTPEAVQGELLALSQSPAPPA